MNWEAVTAISTAVTAFVIAATVLVGYRQVDHLRRATQLDGTLRIFDEINQPEIRAAHRFVVAELPSRLKDPQFRAEIATVGLADEKVHQELYVLRLFEKVGTYVRHRLIDPALVYDFAGPWIVDTWESLDESGVIAEHRRMAGDNVIWENFEYLYRGVGRWGSKKGTTFPGWRNTARALSSGSRSESQS